MASISGARKIVLQGDQQNWEEGPLAAVASPGMNVAMTNAADAQGRQTYTPAATKVGGTAAGAAASPIKLVLEDRLQGKTIDQSYASGDNVFLYLPKKGDRCQVLVASGQTVLKGDPAYAIASGLWNVAAAGAAINRVGEFLEASGGALGANTLMRVRFD